MTPVQDKGWGEMGVVLTVVLVVLTIVLQTYSCQNRYSHVLPQNRSSHIRTYFKGGSSGVTDLFFFNDQKKGGEGKSWRMVRETFLRGIYTVLELRAYDRDPHFFDFCWTISKKSISLCTKCLAHISIRSSFPFSRNIRHPFPCSKQHCSPDTYAICFRAPGTYAIHFRSPDTDSIRLRPTWSLSISFSQACTQT